MIDASNSAGFTSPTFEQPECQGSVQDSILTCMLLPPYPTLPSAYLLYQQLHFGPKHVSFDDQTGNVVVLLARPGRCTRMSRSSTCEITCESTSD